MAVDESAASKDAVAWAKEKLLVKSDAVHLVSVLTCGRSTETFSGVDGSYLASECTPDPLELDHRCELLKKYKETLKSVTGKVDTTTLVTCLSGSTEVGREISQLARVKDADIVVIGSRGMGSAEKAIKSLFGLGSVSDYVVRNCRNVLVHQPKSNNPESNEF